MHYVDRYSAERPRRWLAVDVNVEPRRPGLRVEVPARRCLRISSADRPLVWARQDPHWAGVAWLVADRGSPGVVPPVTARDVATVRDAPLSDTWFASWARWFLAKLDASRASPLYGAEWGLERVACATDPSRPHDGITVDSQHAARRGRSGWKRWPSEQVLCLRTLSYTDSSSDDAPRPSTRAPPSALIDSRRDLDEPQGNARLIAPRDRRLWRSSPLSLPSRPKSLRDCRPGDSVVGGDERRRRSLGRR
jgi:hypothetical protein